MRDLIQVKLMLIVRGEEKERRITGTGEHPPCFPSLSKYQNWKTAAEKLDGSPPPVRKGWPKEPNYCRDCSSSFRNEARNSGTCLFPDTVFVEVGEGQDRETVGVSKDEVK